MGSGTPMSVEDAQGLSRNEVELALRSHTVSQRWDALSNAIETAVSQRQALSTIHENLSSQAASVIADLNAIDSPNESSRLPEEYRSALRHEYSEYSQENSALRSVIGSVDEISRQSDILSQRWSRLSETVARADEIVSFPWIDAAAESSPQGDTQEAHSNATVSEQLLEARSLVNPSLVSGWTPDDDTRSVRDAHQDLTERPGDSFAR